MGGGSPVEEGGNGGESSSSSGDEADQPPAATFEQQVAAAQARAKREAAAEFVRVRWRCAPLGAGAGVAMRVHTERAASQAVRALVRRRGPRAAAPGGRAVGDPPALRPSPPRVLAQVYNLQKASGMGMSIDPKARLPTLFQAVYPD